jgi:hypothetical protein
VAASPTSPSCASPPPLLTRLPCIPRSGSGVRHLRCHCPSIGIAPPLRGVRAASGPTLLLPGCAAMTRWHRHPLLQRQLPALLVFSSPHHADLASLFADLAWAAILSAWSGQPHLRHRCSLRRISLMSPLSPFVTVDGVGLRWPSWASLV